MRGNAVFVATTLGGLFVIQPALAADMPVYKGPAPVTAPLFNWTGPYLGLHGGYGWGDKTWNLTVPIASFDAGADFSTNGWLGGAQIGFNYQIENWVWGLEADFSWSNIDGNRTTVAPNAEVADFSVGLDWLATITGRVGIAYDRSLFYIKGGAAWVREEYGFSSPTLGVAGSTHRTRGGWTVGAGWEWAYPENWTVRLEYNYMDFRTHRNLTLSGLGVVPAPPPDPSWDIEQQVHAVKFAINYRFATPATPIATRY